MERKIEARLEGTGHNELHALEAARIASGLLIDSCVSPHRGLTVAPNKFFVPFKSLRHVPDGFEDEAVLLLAEEVKQRGYRLLAPLSVCAVGPELNLSGIAAEWCDSKGRVAMGYIEGIDGPAKDGLWSIAEGGSVVGRGSEADVRLIDPEVSRRHLAVEAVAPEQFQIEDLGSHNGTRVGKSLILQPTLVKAGTKLSIGASVLRLWALPWAEEQS
ncbi:FHA domain-containing protein [bacterium]|nr:FHA domain-containing protein [bacterium]